MANGLIRNYGLLRNPLGGQGNTNTMVGSGGGPAAAPAPDMRNNGNGGNDVNIGLMPGGAPAGGPATLSTLSTMGGMINNQPGSSLTNPMARGGNNNTIIRPNPGMGIPTLNGAAKSIGGAAMGTGASGTGNTQIAPNPLGTSNVVGAPSLTSPLTRPAQPGGPGSGIPPGNGLANTKVGSVGGQPALPPDAGHGNNAGNSGPDTGGVPGRGPLNFNLTYQDYLDSQKAKYGNASEGGGAAPMSEADWNALGQSGQWNQMDNGFAMQSNDPRYAAIAQQLGIKPGTTGPDGTIMFGTGHPDVHAPRVNGQLSFVDPNAVLQGDGVWATPHPNFTPEAEYSGGGLSDKGWGIAALSLLGGGAALGGALGGAGAAGAAGGSSALQTGGILTGADVAGGTSGAGYIGGVSAGVPGGAAAGSTGMTGAGPNAGPPEAPPGAGEPPPGGAGANGYGTPGGTPEQPFGSELPNVNSPTLDPMTTQGVNPLGATPGATPASGLTPGQVYNGVRTALGGASLVNSLVNGGGSQRPGASPGKTGGVPGPGGSGPGGSGNTGGNDDGGNGLPSWLNDILGLAGTGLGAAQQNKNINTFKGMSNDLFNKGDYNQAYRPGYLDKLNKAFNDPDSLLQDEGYKNMRKDAMDNLSRQEAARGMSLSGNEMGDLTRLQSNMDYAQINNTRQQLMGAANLGDPSGMAKAQMLTLPFLFNAMNNRDASVGAAAGRSGNPLLRWLNGGGGRGTPGLPGGGSNGGYPSGSGPNEKPQEVDENGNPINGDDGGLPGPDGSGPNGPDGDVGNPYGPGGEDGGDGPTWYDDPGFWE